MPSASTVRGACVLALEKRKDNKTSGREKKSGQGAGEHTFRCPHPRSKDPTGGVSPSATWRLVLRAAMDRGQRERQGKARQGRENLRSLDGPACNATEVDSHAGGGLRPATLMSRQEEARQGKARQGKARQGKGRPLWGGKNREEVSRAKQNQSNQKKKIEKIITV